MKKLLCLLIALALLTGCSPQEPGRNEVKADFYYESEEDNYFSPLGILGCEQRTLQQSQNSLEGLLELYLRGPVSPELTFPENLRFVRAEYAQQAITLVFEDSLAELTDLRLQLVCACIARTVSEFGGYETVYFRTEHLPLADQEYLCVIPEKLVLEDRTADRPNALVTLYFSDQDNRYLIGEKKSVPANENDDVLERIVRGLIDGPESDSLKATMPEGTTLQSVSVVDKVCVVNFSDEFYTNRPQNALAERMTIFSVVNSLAQLEDVEAVDIRVQGRKLKRYVDLDLSRELLPDDRMIGPPRSGVGEFDATLYVCLEGSEALAAFPICIREPEEGKRIGTVLDALCGFQGSNGYFSPARELVLAHEEQEENGVVSVMLTVEAPADDVQMQMLLQSVTATLQTIPDASPVRLFVNGQEV